MYIAAFIFLRCDEGYIEFHLNRTIGPYLEQFYTIAKYGIVICSGERSVELFAYMHVWCKFYFMLK